MNTDDQGATPDRDIPRDIHTDIPRDIHTAPQAPGAPGHPSWAPSWGARTDGARDDAAATAEVPTVAGKPRRAAGRARVWALAAAFALTGGGGIAVGAGLGHAGSAATGTTSAQIPGPRWGSGSSGSGSTGSFGDGSPGGFAPGSGSGDGSGSGGGSGSGPGGSTGTSGTTGTTATAAQSAGVVTVDSDLSYQGGESMGTGIVLTSSGEILTNNHVVEGSTSVSVTVVSTGRTYTASVVGTDATHDIAVLQLKGASGLRPATLASSTLRTGEAVTGVGNAGGTGSLTAAAGTVTATGASITTEAEGSAASESLSGLIQTDAAIQSGDSGGPLFNASGQVVGIDTAASSGGAQVQGFAIPISSATAIARQIESGTQSGTVTIGLPAFLGVELSSTTTTSGTGAVVAGTVQGGPAAGAGITGGDTITAVDGTAVSSSTELSAALSGHEPGDSVTVSWTDAAGASHHASLTLAEGPAA